MYSVFHQSVNQPTSEVDDESEAQELDYAEQTQLIAKKAKLALVNRQIEDLKRAKKTISMDYASADAQLALAEVRTGELFKTTIPPHKSGTRAWLHI